MANDLDGDIKIGVDLETKSVRQSVNNLRKTIAETFGNQNTATLSKNIRKASQEVKSLEKDIENAKTKLDAIKSGDVVPDSIKKLQQQIKETDREAESLAKRLEQMSSQRSKIREHGTPFKQSMSDVKVNGKYFSPEDAATLQRLNADISEFNLKLGNTVQKSDELKLKLDTLQTNPGLSADAVKYKEIIENANSKLAIQKNKLEDLKKQQDTLNNTKSKSISVIENVSKRIAGLAKRVFFFSLVASGFRTMLDYAKKVISANTQLSSSMQRVKGNLLTAFAPIYNIIIPALQSLMNVLAQVTAYVARFVSMLTGTSIDANKKTAKTLYEQATATKAVGNANKQAAKDAEKSALAFDELNVINSPPENASSGGGSGTDTVAPFQTTNISWTDEMEQRLHAIMVLVGSIGGALLLWKIASFIADLSKAKDKLSLFQSGFGKLVGIIAIVAGGILLIKTYCDAWINGLDWGNFLGIISGLALVVGGLVLVLGTSVAPFALIGAGIAALVIGIKDFISSGPTFQNILLVIIGLAAVFAGVWLAAGAPIALIVVAIGGLIAIFTMLWNNCEGFRNFWIGLWETIKSVVMDFWTGTLQPLWEEHIKPFVEEIGAKIQELWDLVLKPIIDAIAVAVEWLWKNILEPVLTWLIQNFVFNIQNAFTTMKDIVCIIFETMGGYIDGFKQFLSGLIDFIVGIFTGDFEKAGEGIKTAFAGVMNALSSLLGGVINTFIAIINGFVRGINKAIKIINKIPKVEIPKLNELEKVSIPKLAQGAVIPPNKEFLAVLGDQKRGTNIEAPLETIIQAMKIALGDYEGGVTDVNINFTGNLAQLARLLNPHIEKEKKRRGTKLVKGGAY